jgi:DNA repair protein RecO (recombination protein O)
VQVKTKAIVLSSLKFQEKLDCKCFTLSHGLKSYLFGMLFQEGNRIKIAYFQPLTILEIEAVHKKQRHFRKFQGNKIASAFHSIHSIFTKAPW